MSPRHFFFTMNFNETAFKYQNGFMNFFTKAMVTKNVLLGTFLLDYNLSVHRHWKNDFWKSLSLIQSFIILKLFTTSSIEFDIQVRIMTTRLRSNLQTTAIMHINMHCPKVNIESILNGQISTMSYFYFLCCYIRSNNYRFSLDFELI